MITFEQALKWNRFHENGCARTIGPRGGVKVDSTEHRRNGRTQTWKTRPGEFRIPTKVGFYGYSEITHRNAHRFHAPDECPLNNTEGEVK